MDQIAEGCHCRLDHTTVFIVEQRRFHDRSGAVGDSVIKSLCGIAARQGDVSYSVSMQRDVIRHYTRGGRRFRHHQTYTVLLANKRHPIAHAGFETAESHRLKSEGGAVKVNSLFRIADIEFDVINSIELMPVGVWQR